LDAFEIQVYDATAVAPRAIGAELHSNSVIRGLTERDGPELAPNHQAHFTLESYVGIFRWWEFGTYFQTAITADGFRYAGTKLRSKFVIPAKKKPETFWERFRFGLNVELSAVPAAFEKGRWGTELRSMVAWENSHFLFAVNPIVGIGKDGPGFAPAVMALYKFEGRVSLGVEYYGDIGTFEKPDPIGKQQHYLFPVANVLAIPHFELNLGGGVGLTAGSNRFVAKIIVGYVWE
jgi:hypothetical protein